MEERRVSLAGPALACALSMSKSLRHVAWTPREQRILGNPRSTRHPDRLSPSDIVPVIEADPEDDVILTCAVKGSATHIVTYDPHFDILGGSYRGIQILRPLNFLYLIRGDVRPSS